MKIVIVGGGLAGTELALALGREGHSVTLVDRDPEVARRRFEEQGLATLVGDGTEPRLLERANVGRADVVAAMLRRDADNLAIASIARTLGAARVLARLREPAYRPIYARAGIDQVFGEVETMVGALGVAIQHPRIRHSMGLGAGRTIAFDVEVESSAWAAGKTIREIGTAPEFPRGAVIAGILAPSGEFEAPRGDSIVPSGSSLLVVARAEEVAPTIALLARESDLGAQRSAQQRKPVE